MIDGVSARLMRGPDHGDHRREWCGQDQPDPRAGGIAVCSVRGEVNLDGAPVSGLERQRIARRRIGYLPQNGQPAWAITVRELAALGRFPHRSAFAAESRG